MCDLVIDRRTCIIRMRSEPGFIQASSRGGFLAVVCIGRRLEDGL